MGSGVEAWSSPLGTNDNSGALRLPDPAVVLHVQRGPLALGDLQGNGRRPREAGLARAERHQSEHPRSQRDSVSPVLPGDRTRSPRAHARRALPAGLPAARRGRARPPAIPGTSARPRRVPQPPSPGSKRLRSRPKARSGPAANRTGAGPSNLRPCSRSCAAGPFARPRRSVSRCRESEPRRSRPPRRVPGRSRPPAPAPGWPWHTTPGRPPAQP